MTFRVDLSRMVLTGALLAGAPMLAACGASDFATPVTAFSNATKVAATNFKDNREGFEKFANARRLKQADDGGTISAKKGDCLIISERCRLVVVDKHGTKLPLTVSLDRLQGLMDGLVTYTVNLVAIVNADTAGTLDKGTEAVKSNLANLAASGKSLATAVDLKNVSFARATPYIGPVADAVSYGLGKALEAQKIAALREATADMEAIFPSLYRVFDAVNKEVRRIQLNQLNAAYRAANLDFRRNPANAAKREAYQHAAENYDAAKIADPKNLFDALRQAHAALATALKKPSPNFEDLWPLLQKATDEANKLAEINKAFQKARTASSK